MLVHSRVDGAADAPAVVLSGSLGTTLELWDPQAEALAPHFRVIRYDRRGHGRSPVPPGPYSLDDLGGDLLALLDELAVERVSFCGLSLGGVEGMWLALEAPERLDRLVLACTAPAFAPPGQWLERAATVRRDGIEPLVPATLERWFTPAAPADVIERCRSMLLGTPREGYAACCDLLAGVDLRDRLGEIAAPTLVVTGADDPGPGPETGDALAAALPQARHETIAGARHLASAERQEQFSDLLRRHLNGP